MIWKYHLSVVLTMVYSKPSHALEACGNRLIPLWSARQLRSWLDLLMCLEVGGLLADRFLP